MTGELWGWLYVGQLCILSLALGSWLLHAPRLLPIPPLSRFFTGVSLPPFVLGAWMLGAAAVAPGAPRWLYTGGPLALSLLLLAWYGPRTLRRLVRAHRRLHRRASNPWPRYLLYAAMVAVLAVVAPVVIAYGEAPVIGHDAAGYLNKALPFAQDRSLDAVADLRHLDKGTYLRDHHGFFFPAYLSHALLHTSAETPGYPHDQAARLAFQVTLVYLLCAMLALAGLVRSLGLGALSIVLLFQVPHLFYIPVSSSRDAYRVIPILLLMANLGGFHPARLRLRLRPAMLLPPLVLAAFCLAGHALGGILAVAITACWLAWGVLQLVPHRRLLLVAAAIAVGLLWNGFRYVEVYRQTGSLLGSGLPEYSFQGTPLEGISRGGRINEQVRTAQQATPLEVLARVFALDQYRLSLPALGVALAVLVIGRFLPRRRAWRVVPFWGLVLIAMTLPMTGLLDYEGYHVSRAFASNDRYSLHLYPLAAVLLAACALFVYEWLGGRHRWLLRWLAPAALLAWTWTATETARATVIQEWPPFYAGQEADLLAALAPLQLAVEQLAPGERLLLDEDRFAYYLNHQALVMTGHPSWQAIRAQTVEEAHAALGRLQVGAVALLQADIPGWWDQLPLYKFLEQPAATLLLQDELQRVYLLAPDGPMRRGLVYALLAQAGRGIAPDRLYEAIHRPPTVAGRDPAALLAPVAGAGYLEVNDAGAVIAEGLARLQKGTADAQTHFVLGQLQRAAGEVDQAIAHYEAALAADPQDGRLPVYLAEAYIAHGLALAARSDHGPAREAMARAHQLAPGEVGVWESIVEAYGRWGTSVVSPTLLGKVLAGYEQAVTQEEENPARHQELAEAYYAVGDLAAAAAVYERMVARGLATRVDYDRLAAIYLQQQEAGKAIDLYQHAMKQHPELAWPLLALGNIYMQQAQTAGP